MKLLTLNCHSWQEENQLDKIEYLAKVINEREYDVIALQEVSQLMNTTLVYDNVREDNFGYLLNEELIRLGNDNYKFFWDASHIGYDIYEEGLCIMSKHLMKNNKSFYVSHSNDFRFWKSRKIVKSTIQYNQKEIDVYSAHLGWWNDNEEPFKNQANGLLSGIDNDKITIVMGDFNNSAHVRNEGYDYLISHGMIDTYSIAKHKDNGTTVKGKIAGWDENEDSLRLDIIFSNRNIDVDKSNVIFNDKNKQIISDHFGVEVDINI